MAARFSLSRIIFKMNEVTHPTESGLNDMKEGRASNTCFV